MPWPLRGVLRRASVSAELAFFHQLDRVAQAHHAEVAAGAPDRVVHRVAQDLLGRARVGARDLRRHRQIVVLLGAQPAEHVAHVEAVPPLVGGRVRAGAVERRAEVEHRRAGGHLGVGDLVRLGLAVVRPAVAAGHDARRAVLRAEVHQRDHRGHLQLRVRARHVHPDQLVAVQELRRRARPARDQVADVELVARARGQQHAVAHAEVDGMGQHLGREGARVRGEARDVPRLVAEEELDGGVQVLHARVGRREGRLRPRAGSPRSRRARGSRPRSRRRPAGALRVIASMGSWADRWASVAGMRAPLRGPTLPRPATSLPRRP